MKAILLNGSQENDNSGERVRAALEAELKSQGWDVEHIVLCDKKIGNCAGDFFCWIRTPGVCNVDDDNRVIAAAIIASDLMVYLTPITAVNAADLVTLAFPLYVDSLPAPVIEALERIAAHRQGRDPSHRQLFTAISNCGFPEAHHNANALAICEMFARQAGFEWAGGLALGGGEMVAGEPLTQGGGKTILIRKALDLAAGALALGQTMPNAAQDIGVLRWNMQAKGYGARKLLKRQPYLVKAK